MKDAMKRLKEAVSRAFKSMLMPSLEKVDIPQGLKEDFNRCGFESAAMVYLLLHTQPAIYNKLCAKHGVDLESVIKKVGRRTPRLLKNYLKKVEAALGRDVLAGKDESTTTIEEIDLSGFSSSDIVFIFKEDQLPTDQEMRFKVGQIIALGGKVGVCSGALAAVHFPNELFQEIDLNGKVTDRKLDLKLPGQPDDFSLLRAFYVHSSGQAEFRMVLTSPNFFMSDPYPAVVQRCRVSLKD